MQPYEHSSSTRNSIRLWRTRRNSQLKLHTASEFQEYGLGCPQLEAPYPEACSVCFKLDEKLYLFNHKTLYSFYPEAPALIPLSTSFLYPKSASGPTYYSKGYLLSSNGWGSLRCYKIGYPWTLREPSVGCWKLQSFASGETLSP
mmetsp:Transcript_6019/g.10622  ORF Transcript_6019/g.10622 Transcript_6019/m.10622 type:complete len:145 (+) Transcript_6019:235-669(+)